ncbi:neurobeachin-like protein 1 [Montipora foliosa]|uniref:neurobeachin-like protein 1 n=1 Tax=Montipora foliosa TaxID=591990 RepID=UPI0035F1FCBF
MAESSETLTQVSNSELTSSEPQDIWNFVNDKGCSASKISPGITDKLFRSLESRELSNLHTQNDLSKKLDDAIYGGDQSYELAVASLIKIIHLIHHADLKNQHQCLVDTPSLLKRFLDVIPLGETCSHSSVHFKQTLCLLDAIPKILDCNDSAVLQAVFVGIGCFPALVSVLDFKCLDDDEQNKLYHCVVGAIKRLTHSSSAAKEVFKHSVGFEKFCSYLQRLESPLEDFIQLLFDWAVEGDYSEGNKVINNVDVILLLLDWLPSLTVDTKSYVTECIRRLCRYSVPNAMLCSTSGVFSKVVMLLESNMENVDKDWAESLIGILESIGSHSVTSRELKQLIGLFAPMENGAQVPFAYRLLQALVKMSFSSSRLRAKHYYDLHHPSAGISVPGLQKWPGNSFTFHAWVCLGPADIKEGVTDRRQSNGRKIFHFRRILYSFFTTSGVGLEAFFASTGHLVVAVCHRKDYTTVTVPVCQLCDQKWHSIAVSHLPSRRPFGQTSVSVYVDGVLRINFPLKFPGLSEDLAVCQIGSGSPRTVLSPKELPDGKGTQRKFHFSFPVSLTGLTTEPSSPHCSTIGAGSQDYVWGVPTSLQGQLGPVCVFSEGLQEQHIIALHTAGPNDLNLFQPIDNAASTQLALSDLTLKLVLFYNSKAGRDHMCSDLTPIQQGRVQLDGRLTGYRCTTWDMKDVLRCIGGMKIFLPLLEQISYFEPPKSANGISEQREEFELEKETEEKVQANYERSPSSTSEEELTGEKECTETADSQTINISASACGLKQQDDWVFINDNHDLRFYKKEIYRLCKSHNCNGAALFMFLLLSILTGHDIKDEEFAETLSYVGSILRNMDLKFINVQVLRALQALVECVTNDTVLQSVHENLLFDFRIWSSSEFNVRIGHIQFISTQIKDNPTRFRSEYGVRFFLDIISQHYGGNGAEANSAGRNRENEVQLAQEEVKIIRASLLGLIKFYLTENVEREEVWYIVEYLTCVTDPQQIIEVLDVLLSLCERASKSKMAKRLSDPRHIPVFVTLMICHRNEPLRLKILKLMANIIMSSSVPEGNRNYWHLRSVGLSAVTERLRDEVSQPLVESLLRLGVSEHDENKGVDVLMHYHVVLAVLEMIENEGLETKLYVSHMILRSLDANHLSLTRCAKEYGWHVTLLRLITVPFGSRPYVPSEVSGQSDNVSEEKKRGEENLIDTVLEIVFRVMWKGVEGFGENDWKVRGQAIAAVSIISSAESFLVPHRAVERRLLELCLQGAVEDIRVSGQTGEAETQNALMVMRLVEDFIFTPAGIAGAGDEDDSDNWSVKLVENVVLLLEVLNVWDENEENVEWTEMAQVGVRILLAFISRPETEYCATASSKLSKLLKARKVTSQGELCHILGQLHQAFVSSKEKADSRNYTFIVPVIRMLLRKYHDTLPLTIYMPTFSATDGVQQQAQEDFLELMEGEEFKAMMKQQIYPGMKQYENTFSQSSLASGRFLMDCLSGLTVSLNKKERAQEESREKFDEQITQSFKQLQDSQRQHIHSVAVQEKHVKSNISRQWKLLKRTLMSERSPWASRVPSEAHWKLSHTENFQRMRLKLTRNYVFTPHTDASHARDNVTGETDERVASVPVRVAREAVVQNVDEDVLDVEEPGSPPGTGAKERVRAISETEKSLLGENCELITLMDIVPGKFEVTTTHVYFYADDETAGRDFQWPLSELREVHLRRHNLRRSALEFFLIDQTNYFLNFDKETRNKVYRKIMSLRPRNLYYIGARSPAYLLKTSGLTDKWVHRDISNFEYLMQLNTISGRTYNDLSQYPVFPWILVDYTSEELRLDDPAVYRDLSKPIGALNPDRVDTIRDRYNTFVDPSGLIAKFHYGSHYSSSAGVLFYLLRVEPFTTLHIKLQSGRFDCADRQFHNVPATWDSVYSKGADVKELIPEFFYFPDFLVNSNRFDLGHLQRGQPVDDVILPQWATSPEDFVRKHRQALESDYVSAHLHEWIDLIFGYKQKGPEAEKALNVFYYCTYEGAVDLDAITDPAEREATEGMINNFGQTPTQLLTQPHPQRMTAEEAAHKFKAIKSAGTSKTLETVFENLEKLKPYFVNVSDSADALVFVAVSKLYTRSLIYSGMPEHMITISQNGILGVHNWLPYSKTKANPFTFELDPSLSSNRLRRCIAGPFIIDLEVSSRLFVVTHDAKMIITAGHWDNSFRVFNTKGKLLYRIVAHTDVVTCLSLDDDGHHLITGSRDSTCRLWGITHQGGVAQELIRTPLQTLYGHDKPITCVAMSWELDMAVSGSQDGTCIIYTARKGEYVITLRPMGMELIKHPSLCQVTSLALSEYGDIVVFCRDQSNGVLCRYSINGKLLSKDLKLKESIVDMFVFDEFLVTGGVHGRLEIRTLHSFQVVLKMNLVVPIRSVSLARDSTHLFVCLQDGKLIVITVDNS